MICQKIFAILTCCLGLLQFVGASVSDAKEKDVLKKSVFCNVQFLDNQSDEYLEALVKAYMELLHVYTSNRGDALEFYEAFLKASQSDEGHTVDDQLQGLLNRPKIETSSSVELLAWSEALGVMGQLVENLEERKSVFVLRIRTQLVTLIEESKKNRETKEEEISKVRNFHQKMEFIKIKAGLFEMGDHKGKISDAKKVQVNLTQDFEIMSTLVTQYMWLMVMGDNPSTFKKGASTIELKLGDKLYRLQPNHPVESVSWNDVQDFITKLNELSKANDPLLKKLILDHQSGYEYGLPTEAQWEYVVRNQGTITDDYHFGDDVTKLGEYAWCYSNSNYKPHPVAQKKPLIINGQAIYDLHGNVWEWVQDAYSETLLAGNDPVQKGNSRSVRVLRGGCWNYGHVRYLQSAYRNNSYPDDRSGTLGFRLLRVRKSRTF